MQLKTIFAFRAGILGICACLFVSLASVRAEELPLRDLLRDGLFAEEVSRDPEAAAKRYEELISRYSEGKDFAAAALFRLAEVRRKQDRKEEAVALYQKLLVEFPTAANETKLARENLVALGGKPPEVKEGVVDAEAMEMARLQSLAKSSPDVMVDPLTMDRACGAGWARVVKLMLDAGADPFAGEALPAAASNGHLEIVKLLLAGNTPVPRMVARETMEEVILSNRLAVLKFLLERGFNPENLIGTHEEIPALFFAVKESKFHAAAVFVAHGVDIDVIAEFRHNDHKVRGTALHLAILENNYEAADWLLEKGAKPNVPATDDGLTPLQCALMGDKEECIPMIEKLLLAGADPNAVTFWKSFSKKSVGEMPATDDGKGAPALVIAILADFKPLEKIDLLLKHGAKPAGHEKQLTEAICKAVQNKKIPADVTVGKLLDAGASAKALNLLLWAMFSRSDAALVEVLLKHGDDPNSIPDIRDEGSLLGYACRDADPRMIRLLLDAGADVGITRGHPDEDLLRTTSMNQTRVRDIVECLTLLADAGVRPSAEWKKSRYEKAGREALPFLMKRFIIPDLTEKGGVSFVNHTGASFDVQSIADGPSGGKFPQLDRWLLDNGPELSFVKVKGVGEYRWQLWRRNAEGKLTATELDFSESGPLPDLQAGDVVVCQSVTEGSTNIKAYKGLSPEMQLSLRKRISFPVTIEHHGKNREMTLRGDRVIFDPTKDELPLADVQSVVRMLWQTTDYPEVKPGMINQVRMDVKEPGYIVIERKDWPEVRLRYGSKEADKFQLEAGDRVKVELSKEFLDGMERFREYVVTLQVVGHPVTRRYGIADKSGILAPTLIQALVDMQVPRERLWSEWAGRDTLGASDLGLATLVFQDFTLLPHPDLARLRIRRLQEGGTEKVIEVDLAKAASSVTDGTTADEARKLDVDLQGGDIVEIPLKEGSLGEPWKGFSEREMRFFRKALSGQVQLVSGQGDVRFSAIDIRPLKYIETELGLLPAPPEEGQASPRAKWFANIGMGDAVTRGGFRQESNAWAVFMRGGDELRTNGDGSGPRVVPQQVHPPQPGVPSQPSRTIRPRVEPPPTPSVR